VTLRLRLLLGYGYLVLLLLLATGTSLVAFLHLSAGIEAVLEENFFSIRAAMVMIEALERQDSATLAALIEGREELVEAEAPESSFEEALEEASANVTEEGEAEVLAAIREGYGEYRAARARLLAARPERPLAAYEDEVFPLFAAVKSRVLELLTLNQRAMFQAEREARQTAVRGGTWLGFLVVVALVSLVLLSRAMQRRILSRIERLVSGMTAIAGRHRRRLREEGEDELARIARQVNRLLDQYDRLEASTRGRLSQERRLVQGLVAALGPGTALFGLSGELWAGELGGRGAEERVADWIRTEGSGAAEAGTAFATSLPADGAGAEAGELRLELVVAPGERPVGWLARPAT
jgi:HAMP domain-containing protein